MEPALGLPTRNSFSETFKNNWGCTVSIMFSKLQGSFFSQTAAFCIVGLCMSFVLVVACDLRIGDAWI